MVTTPVRASRAARCRTTQPRPCSTNRAGRRVPPPESKIVHVSGRLAPLVRPSHGARSARTSPRKFSKGGGNASTAWRRSGTAVRSRRDVRLFSDRCAPSPKADTECLHFVWRSAGCCPDVRGSSDLASKVAVLIRRRAFSRHEPYLCDCRSSISRQFDHVVQGILLQPRRHTGRWQVRHRTGRHSWVTKTAH